MSNINKVCRACLHTKDSFSYILCKNVSAEDYMFCTSIQVLDNEDFPKSLCDNCYKLLINFSTFKRKCIESQDTLLGYKNKLKYENYIDGEICQDSYEEKPSMFVGNHDIKREHLNIEERLGDQSEWDAENDILLNDNDEEFSTWNYNIKDLCTVGVMENGILNKKERKIKVKKIKSKFKKSILKQNESKKVNHYRYKCDICNKKFGYAARFEAHKLTHEGKEMSIECNECKKTFSTWQSHKRHVMNEHSVVNLSHLSCSKCGKLCKSRNSLQMHEKRHEIKTAHVCDVCGKLLNNEKVLKLHLEVHKEDRKKESTCESCGKKFYSKHLLKAHMMRSHTNRFFICSICNYQFSEKHNLIKHIATHEGKKLYKCNICLKAYSSASSVSVHKRTHSGERPYQCGMCPKAFISKKALTDHTRIHTGERPFKCHVCEQSFNQKGTLWRHSRMHNRSTAVVQQS